MVLGKFFVGCLESGHSIRADLVRALSAILLAYHYADVTEGCPLGHIFYLHSSRQGNLQET